ncbi:hypothetical protein [Lysinibacillus sp. NPDC092081]|uniref:hypothetical protein n=1 Tax=Lysinibacillus sp. NPDC092081 TaxID=3364131 RepID=UPI0037F64487
MIESIEEARQQKVKVDDNSYIEAKTAMKQNFQDEWFTSNPLFIEVLHRLFNRNSILVIGKL